MLDSFCHYFHCSIPKGFLQLLFVDKIEKGCFIRLDFLKKKSIEGLKVPALMAQPSAAGIDSKTSKLDKTLREPENTSYRSDFLD